MTPANRGNGSGPAGSYRAAKPMERIVVSLLKGGVAKSETAVSLAFGLAARGRRVLLVDTDVQAHCSDMLGLKPERGLADLVAGWGSPESCLTPARENLWLLAGGNDLAALKMEIARREMASEAVLTEALEVFEGFFDYLVMDTAPGWDTLLVNALYASQKVLSPVSMEPMALSGLVRFQERLQVIRKYKPELKLSWVVPTFVDGRVKKTAEILNQLQEKYGAIVGPPIRYSVKASEAPAFGRTVFEYDAKGNAAKGYNQLTERVIQDCEHETARPGTPGPGAEKTAASPEPPRPPGASRPKPVSQPLDARLKAPEAARSRPPEPRTGMSSEAASGEPRQKDRLTREKLIEKILGIKGSVSPRSRAKIAWVIERLQKVDREWTEVDLKLIDQLMDKMVHAECSPDREEQKDSSPQSKVDQGRAKERVSGPLTARLQKNKPLPNAEEGRIGTRETGSRSEGARVVGG